MNRKIKLMKDLAFKWVDEIKPSIDNCYEVNNPFKVTPGKEEELRVLREIDRNLWKHIGSLIEECYGKSWRNS